MFDKLVKEMLDKGLIEGARKDGVLALNKLYQQLIIMKYTSEQTIPDMFTAFLRKYREN